MPLYEYKCSKCGHEEEVLKNITDETDQLCEECNEPTEKLISLSSFDIKGYAPGKALKNSNQLKKQQAKHRDVMKKR